MLTIIQMLFIWAIYLYMSKPLTVVLYCITLIFIYLKKKGKNTTIILIIQIITHSLMVLNLSTKAGLIYIQIILIFFLSRNIYKKRKQKNVQENWNDYFRKHPNTNIYWQPRHPKYRDNAESSSGSSAIPWRFIIFVFVALLIISKIAS